MKNKQKFESERNVRISNNSSNAQLNRAARNFANETLKSHYSYNFSWMGRPVIQYPQDMVAMQEIIWDVQPDLIIETGIAHGGSLIMYAAFMEMMGIENGHILGIDIDIREHNRVEIEAHPMAKRISMIQGSSIDTSTVEKVRKFAKDYERILVVLDSNHTHDHVLNELNLYNELVTKGSYCVVFDTVVEDMPEGSFPDRPWDKGDNPKTAVWEFLEENDRFEIDSNIQNKLLVTVAPDGYLKRIK